MLTQPLKLSTLQTKTRHHYTTLNQHPTRIEQAPFNFSDYATHVFNHKEMKKRLPLSTYTALLNNVQHCKPVDPESINIIAESLKNWALEKNATHFAHWFQPLTGGNAEKHDSFLEPFWRPCAGSEISTQFSGRSLCSGESDASSFPSGGLRCTHEARGYNIWDPMTPVFIKDVAGVKTMTIPTVWYSWTGDSLGLKAPALRSQLALKKAVIRVMEAIDEMDHGEVFVNCGPEQEFFLVDKEMYERRPDLVLTGRTLQGSTPAKGQELSDHYFGSLSSSVLRCIDDFEQRAWRLGIPVATRHQEVAPNQFEIAPVYGPGSVSADLNSITMSLLEETALDHNMVCLLHEKPFAGVNGSGKHNNMSFGTSKIPNFLNPGPDPRHNHHFMLALTAFVMGIDMNQDILRHSVSGASNDHRLGAHEAPPAIMSVSLGYTVTDAVVSIIQGMSSMTSRRSPSLRVPHLPDITFDQNDRNRTSPVAFNGKNFEIRAAGSSQSVARTNIALYSIVADALNSIAAQIIDARTRGDSVEEAIEGVIRRNLDQHRRIIFNGDNYSSAWEEEASDRGLLNLKNSVDSIEYFDSEKNRELFKRTDVLNENEIQSIINVDYETYAKSINIEALSTVEITERFVIPQGARELAKLHKGAKYSRTLKERATQLAELIDQVSVKSKSLQSQTDQIKAIDSEHAKATFACGTLLPQMNETRKLLDEIESLTYSTEWPLPSYRELLFTRN